MQITFFLTLLSYLALALGLVIHYGQFDLKAFVATFFGLLSLAIAIFHSIRMEKNPETKSVSVIPGLAYGIFLSLLFILMGPSPIYPALPGPQQNQFLLLILLVTPLLGVLFWGREKPRVLFLFFILILLVWLVSSLWVIKTYPDLNIDVWKMQQEASVALLKGENPYRKVFSLPFETTLFQVTDRYVYPPFTLLLTTIFYYLFGDIRYGALFCQIMAGLFLLGICKRSGKNNFEAILFCILFLFHPRWHFILEMGWTEPTFIVLLFASVYFLLKEDLRIGAAFTGLFLAAKQYLFPLVLFYPRFFKAKPRLWGLVLFSFVSLPLIFISLSPADFYRNLIEFHLASAFRGDSLSLSTFLYFRFHRLLSTWVPFLFLGATLFFALRHKKTYLSALISALAYYLFFWLNKQAFINYYFFVEALLILGLALIPHRKEIENAPR